VIMMFSMEYSQDIYASHLIITVHNRNETVAHEEKMLFNNEINHLLEFQLRYLEGIPKYYYDTRGRKSLSVMCQEKQIGYEQLSGLFRDFIEEIDMIDNYLLDPDNIIFQEEYIYYDGDKKSYSFVYLPGYMKSMTEQLREIVSRLMKNVDHSNQKAVLFIYGLYNIIFDNYYSAEKLRNYMEKEEGKNQGMPSGENIVKNVYKAEEVIKNVPDKKEEQLVTDKKNKNVKIGLVLLDILVIGVIISILLKSRLFNVAAFMSGLGKSRICLLIIAGFVVFAMILLIILIRKKVINDEAEEDFWTPYEENNHQNLMQMSRGTEILSEMSGDAGTKLLNQPLIFTLQSVNPDKASNLKITELPCMIGKSVLNSLCRIDNQTVSRRHAKIYREKDGLYMIDLDSTNGTYVNDIRLEKLEPHEIKHGDYIRFSDMAFLIVLEAGS